MRFSIITCTLNSEKYLQRNIDSIKNQTFKDYEHIFIDGFSKDRTIEIIKKYQQEFPEKVKLFQYPAKGIADAMNKGIENASGEYINHLHSDDNFYNSEVLKKVSDFIQKNNNPEWIYGKAKFTNESNGATRIVPHRRIYHKIRFWLLLLTDYVAHQAVFLQRNLFRKYGMFDTQYKNAMDYCMWLRLSQKKVSSIFMDEIICNFLLHEKSQSVIGYYHKEYEKICPKYVHNKILIFLLNSVAAINRRRTFL
jgi:glycosyltransferase involved in cell wall biosynthesis